MSQPAPVASWCPIPTGVANGLSANPPHPGQADSASKGSNSGSLKLAGWQMLKIAAAVFTMRAGFHLVPVGISRLLKSSEQRLKIETDNRLLKFMVGRIHGLNKFLTNGDRKPHASRLYKSLMAIVDGLMMLYVGGQVDRYFCKKNDNFKPNEVKDPEKVVDKVLLVLIATERMEAIMHHFFHWLDPKAKSGKQFMYGELAALSAVLLDTTVKIASDRYRLRKNAENSGERPGPVNPAQGQNTLANPGIHNTFV